jgi:hypothetical protein
VLYVCPLAGGWVLDDLRTADEAREQYADLESAVRAANAYVERWEREHEGSRRG